MWRLAFWWRGWRYHWRRARRVVEEAPYGFVPAADLYGSMILDQERPPGWWLTWPDPPPRIEVAHSGWYGQTRADLAPEALDEFYEWANYCTPHCPDDTCRAFGECAWRHDQPSCYPGCPRHDPADSGPGVPALVAPGPDPDGGGGVPGSAHEPVWPTLPPRPASDLGPNAARVLARYERRFQERWGCRLASAAA